MWLDPTGFRAGHVERVTVCVIGSGPAGMTLALALEGAGIDVIVVEAGGDGYDPQSQDLFEGEVIGDRYFELSEARLRMFGGSSGHWGGICRPLSRVDFTVTPPTGVPGWPIDFDDLAPYTAAAAEVAEIPGAFEDRELAPGFYRLDYQQSSPPVQFGDKYWDRIETSPRLHAALNSALVDLETRDGRIVSASIFSDPDRRWRIEAEYFVLCAGGIENSRLLSWINARNDTALVANHDLIGRYWMEHLHSVSAHGLIFDETMVEEAADTRYFLGVTPLSDTDGHSGANFEIMPIHSQGSRDLLDSMLCVAPRLGNWVTKTLRARDHFCGVRLATHSEQWPRAENRVTLGNEPDRLGIPQTVLHWERSLADRATAIAAAEAVAEAFAEADLGRMMMTYWTFDDDREISFPGSRTAAWHHMGGTRMSNSPDHGIVDRDLKVHDQDNLYIGGSSVFATGGDANPTFTIVQLSLRLADHLKARLQS